MARTVEIDGTINVAAVCEGFDAIDAISESPCKLLVAFSSLVLLEWWIGYWNAKSLSHLVVVINLLEVIRQIVGRSETSR
jgi:hypothetical protein